MASKSSTDIYKVPRAVTILWVIRYCYLVQNTKLGSESLLNKNLLCVIAFLLDNPFLHVHCPHNTAIYPIYVNFETCFPFDITYRQDY